MKPSYLTIRTSDVGGTAWDYVSAPERLVVVLTRSLVGDLIAIRQYREPVGGWVLSPPMGTVPLTLTDAEEVEFAVSEAEAETGYRVLDCSLWLDVFRSPGLTDEIAHVYRAIVDNSVGTQKLHKDERIEVINFGHLADVQEARNKYPRDGIDSAFPYYFV